MKALEVQLPLKTMAAEAPITAKKGEYSGLPSDDILALLSWGGRAARRANFFSLSVCVCERERQLCGVVSYPTVTSGQV